MSLQRRRGQTATVYSTKVVEDKRGNKHITVDMTKPQTVRAAFIPDRSARAEVPGQQQINVFRMIVRADIEGVNLWSRVKWNGSEWDIVAPPAYHHGSRQVRHWSLTIRERPPEEA